MIPKQIDLSSFFFIWFVFVSFLVYTNIQIASKLYFYKNCLSLFIFLIFL